MRLSGWKTVYFKVKFTDRNSVWPLLEDLGRDLGVALNVLRGRITEDEASLELEITGNPRRVDEFIRRSAEWGASVGATPAGVA